MAIPIKIPAGFFFNFQAASKIHMGMQRVLESVLENSTEKGEESWRNSTI